MSKDNIYVKCPKCGRVAEVGIATNFKACYYCPNCEISSLSKCWQKLVKTKIKGGSNE